MSAFTAITIDHASAVTDDETIATLQARVAGKVSFPGEPGYELSVPWNVAVPMMPRAVIAVSGAEDVAEVVRFAAAHRLRVVVQRTGHGAVATDGNDILLIHTGRLGGLEIDPQARVARIGAGLVWQDVIHAAAAHGLAPLAGSAPGVGVVGFLTGGGIGPLVRTFGLSSDSVRAFDVVTGNGRRIRATAEENPEVFWGLRGGKATLGIVCAVEIDLHPIAELHGGAIYFDGEDAAAVLHAWGTWAGALPEHANTSVALLQLPPLPQVPPPLAGRLTVAVRFASTASCEVCQALLAPLRAVATPLIDTVGPMPYAAIGAIHADPVDPMPTHESAALLRELPSAAIDRLLSIAGPGSGSPQVIVELRLLGGAYGRPGAHPSAFCQRDAAFSLLSIGVLAPAVADLVVSHGKELVAALAEFSTGGALPSFAPSADRARTLRCYDEDTRIWLEELAEQHDPAGVLRVGQVVRRA
jgi:hypothetical protein